MAFTEFYTNTSTGSNLNAGSTEGSPVNTYTGGTWTSATVTFVKVGGDFSAVSVGMFGSVYPDASASPAVFVSRITNVNDATDTVILSTTAKSGTSPVDGVTNTTLVVGGVWKGCNAAENFPFGFAAAAMTDAGADPVRVNLKNNSTYNITAAITHNLTGYIRFEGYTTTAGDGGRATIDGGTAGASYVLFTCNSGNGGRYFKNLIFQNNGATGNANGILLSQGNGDDIMEGCVVNSVRGSGFAAQAAGITLAECEAYSCNQSNTNGMAGFALGASSPVIRCISHDNSGASNVGFVSTSATSASFIDCISDTNGSHGFSLGDALQHVMVGCESYNNGGDGVRVAGTAGFGYAFNFSNCNFVKNGGYGVNLTAGIGIGFLYNCGFGSGTQANTSGQTNIAPGGGVDLSTVITYASGVTPWVDPANGDFRINLAAATGTGRGTFTETAASYSGTVGYPSIGAAEPIRTTSPPTTPGVVIGIVTR